MYDSRMYNYLAMPGTDLVNEMSLIDFGNRTIWENWFIVVYEYTADVKKIECQNTSLV